MAESQKDASEILLFCFENMFFLMTQSFLPLKNDYSFGCSRGSVLTATLVPVPEGQTLSSPVIQSVVTPMEMVQPRVATCDLGLRLITLVILSVNNDDSLSCA